MIKNKIKISLPIHLKLSVLGLFIAVFSLALLGGVNYANAADLTWTDDTTVTIDSANYTIQGGSAATSIVVGTTTLTVTVPAGSNFILLSANKYLLNNNQQISLSCGTSSSLSVNQALTVIITPDKTQTCVVASGGSGSADITAPTSTSVSISAGATTTASTSVTLTLAATGASHMMIANTSAFTGASWETYATSKAWTLTTVDGVKTVYAKFKDTAGNISTAVSDTITLGVVAVTTLPAGCLTGDVFSATTGLSCAVATVATTTTLPAGCAVGDVFSATTGTSCGVTTVVPVVVPGCSAGNLFSATSGASCGTTTTTTTTTPATTTTTTPATTTTTTTSIVVKFTKSITTKSLKADIKNLQTALNEVAGTSLVIDGMWGPKTTVAVKKFQTANSLVADGMFGPKSLAKMNTLLGL